MTKAAIKKAFRKLDATEQAEMLKELAASLVESLTEEDLAEARVFEKRRLWMHRVLEGNECV